MTQFDPTLLERGLVCSPGALVTIEAAIISIQKIAYYKGVVSNKSKFHITLGHETVMGKLSIFVCEDKSTNSQKSDLMTAQHLQWLNLNSQFDFSREYAFREELQNQNIVSHACLEEESNSSLSCHKEETFALVELDHPVTCAADALVIGSRLDTNVHTSSCRIAFYGKIVEAIADSNYKKTVLPQVKVFKVSIEIMFKKLNSCLKFLKLVLSCT